MQIHEIESKLALQKLQNSQLKSHFEGLLFDGIHFFVVLGSCTSYMETSVVLCYKINHLKCMECQEYRHKCAIFWMILT